eukprot:gnl/TRDRNA2_/TRDRNA2_170763_c2_seq1.p1 gnl/TRDRNA2_/TRDRNA2_170763_c2~~gnl/TRDRNA2_/TRDRNA2_170763_c2_seq1.p1  ORF type:complete len:105 (-),score=5.04 gnl/TRDRNA2_/TRDRNA2_170763_c2_seq1:69-383(-)
MSNIILLSRMRQSHQTCDRHMTAVFQSCSKDRADAILPVGACQLFPKCDLNRRFVALCSRSTSKAAQRDPQQRMRESSGKQDSAKVTRAHVARKPRVPSGCDAN